jgi:hypothetical protein
MQNHHIRGFQLNVDTGEVKPICCKQPQCGPHKSGAIVAPVKQLEKKGTIKDEGGPWGSYVALTSKPGQAHMHWSEFVFWLCISCRVLNTVTRPFTFPQSLDATKQQSELDEPSVASRRTWTQCVGK